MLPLVRSFVSYGRSSRPHERSPHARMRWMWPEVAAIAEVWLEFGLICWEMAEIIPVACKIAPERKIAPAKKLAYPRNFPVLYGK